ncbi:MAG: hypothetical protein V3S05_06240 [Desulfobacterales bacterium]
MPFGMKVGYKDALIQTEMGVEIMLKVAVLINGVDQQFEGLRTSLGLLCANAEVQMFVLHHEIGNMNAVYRENLEWLDEMEGEYFSDNQTNVEKHGFKHATIEEIAPQLKEADIIIPF